MDKKKSKKGGESLKFMEKLFTRLKMTKNVNDEKVSAAKKTDSPSYIDSNPLSLWSCEKITAENMMQFSDQLQQLLKHIEEMKEVTFYTYDYPNQLNNKLEREAIELRNLFRDVRAAAIDIDRLKKQRHIVKKEKNMAQKRLGKLREEEMKELESIINVYAKPLFCKWESIKNTQKPEVLENFMNEITGKHKAMEILQELIKRKLGKLEKKQSTSNPYALKQNISSSNMGNKITNQYKTATSSWNITTTQDLIKISSQTNDRPAKTSAERDILRVNRRKRPREVRDDKRRQITDSGTTVGTVGGSNIENDSVGLDLQLIPIDGLINEELDNVIASRAIPVSSNSTRSPPAISVEYASDDDSVSLSSSDFIIENFVRNANPEVQADLQNEMRNVLQALFGEIRTIPQLSYGGRNRHSNSGNDIRSSRTASH